MNGLELRYDEAAKHLTCLFSGQFASANCPPCAQAIEQKLKAIAAGGKLPDGLKITFDLAQAEYLSSVFLRIVLLTAKRVPKGRFALVRPNPFVQELIRTSGLDSLLLDSAAHIESVMRESRIFPPPPAFAAAANIRRPAEYEQLYRESMDHPDDFWANQAGRQLVWSAPWQKVCEWNLPDARWFAGGKLNACVNCLDRHLNTPIADKPALIWESEPVNETGAPAAIRVLTYRELHAATCQFAGLLRQLGTRRGDRVLIYLPMTPEAAIAMLACARIGAVHSVVFGGFSAQAVADRVRDSGAALIVTADGGRRRGAIVPLKANVDAACELRDPDGRPLCDTVRHVIVLRHAGNPVAMTAGRDVWWQDAIRGQSTDCAPEAMDSEDPLFILYTSGSTGKPKGICHTTAGYLLGAKTSHQWIFDIRDADIYWCTADIGWITGHTYVVYGPLMNGATVLMYEGAPNFPGPDRFWRIIARHRVTIFYTAPTAIRAFMQWGDDWPRLHDLSSLRLLGTVGEPINPQAWVWYHDLIGAGRCPIVDTWWQTETGGIMISTFPGAMDAKPGAAGRPLPGVDAAVVDDLGRPTPANTGGRLVIRRPWPGMLRGVWGDRERFQWTYWREIPGCYVTGDSARQDPDGYFWIMGRIDDVLNVAGHRIGTAEVESALVSHPAVAEAAVVGRADDVKGFALIAFVILRSGVPPTSELREELRRHVGAEVGAVAKPDEIRWAQALPKTRSGKIMRRLLKQIAAGTEISGDVTTLEDFNVVANLATAAEE